jgi:hypothetical protein
LIRLFQPALAENAFFGVVAGSVVAIVGGIFLAWLFLTLAHSVTPATLRSFFSGNGQESIDFALGIIPLHESFRESVQLFLVMQGVGLHMHIAYAGGSVASVDYSPVAPLHGLLILPALLLTIGGYVAASTDLRNQVQSSLLRGGAISIPYTLLLLILSSQANGNVPVSVLEGSESITLTMDTATLLIFGLLWGTLFGLLGASLKIGRGQWRYMLHQFLRNSTHPQLAGMLAGGCCASGLGLGLSCITLYGFLAYTAFSVPWLKDNLCMAGDWQLLTAWGITQGPLHAVNLFLFSFGVPITIHPSETISQCFYQALPQTALTLRDGNLHFAPWVYALLLLPALSLFMGGRVSVALARTQAIGSSAIQGLLIVVPFTVLMVLLAFISSVTSTFVFADSAGTTPVPHVESAGAGMIDILLWALLSGALFGALGGIYEGSTAKSKGQRFLSGLASIIQLPVKPFYALLDHLSGQPSSSRHSPVRSLLYGALLCTLLLAVASAVVGWILIANNQTISIDTNLHLRDIVSTLLITIPGLLLFCACATALARDPLAEGRHQPPRVEP